MPRLREPGHRQRARIACRTCRQSKLRCGLVENPPCPRCSKLGLDCVVDPQYQRIQNRDKIEELEDQLGHLREQLVTHREPDRSSSATYGNPKRASDDTPCSQQNQAEAPIVLQHVSTPYPLARNGTSEPTLDTIGDVVLRPGQAEALFSLYFSQFHQFLPVLDSQRSHTQYFQVSPLLYWTIITTASRQYRADGELLTQLCTAMNSYLWTVVSANPMSMYCVQALLLLSCWPLPNLHLWTDYSLILSNVALTSALHLGCHRPGREEEYSRETRREGLRYAEEIQLERTKTWTAAVAMSQSLSDYFGHLPLLNVRTSASFLSAADIPSNLKDFAMIQGCMQHCLQQVTYEGEPPSDLPQGELLFSRIEQALRNLEELESQKLPKLSFINQMRLINAKVSLHCLAFISDARSDSRKRTILKAYEIASDLINFVLGEPNSHSILPYAPLAAYRYLMMAAVVILRVVHSTYSSAVDTKPAHLLFRSAAFAIRQLSCQHGEKNIAVRSSEMLALLWQGAETDEELKSQPPAIRVKSRMGSSVVFDTLILARSYAARERETWLAWQKSHNPETVQGTPRLSAVSSTGKAFTQQAPPPAAEPNWNQMNMNSSPSRFPVNPPPFQSDSNGFDLSWQFSPDMSWIDNFGYPQLFDWYDSGFTT